MTDDERDSLADGVRALTSPRLWKLLAAVWVPLAAVGGWAWHELLARATQRAETVREQVAKDVADSAAATKKVADADRAQLVEAEAARVRYQAAAAEKDHRRREETGRKAEALFRDLVRFWPCDERYEVNCCSPSTAARKALETVPP